MTEQELRDRLKSLTGSEIPAETHRAFLSAVSPGKETKTMKKKISAGLVFALVLILATVAAIATGIVSELSKWYSNGDPELYNTMMEHRVENPEQQQSEDDLVNVSIEEVSWAPEKDTLFVCFRTTVKDPEHFELHGFWDLDTDGSYFAPGETIPIGDLEEAHTEHYLWRDSRKEDEEVRHGPVREMMDDSSKHILLIEYDDIATPIPGADSMDAFRTEDGSVLNEMEFHPGYLYIENDKKIQEEGIPCTINYRIVEYTEGMDDRELYTGGTRGEVSFVLRPGN